MNKIIGGLLVISLLSRPSLLNVDYIAYEIHKASDQIIRSIRSIQNLDKDESEPEVSRADVTAAFARIDKNSKSISKLLKDLTGAMGKINETMAKKAAARTAMSENQITAFSSFSAFYNSETARLDETLAQISHEMGTGSIEIEIASDDSDYVRLHGLLKGISDAQYNAIMSINGVIAGARNTLDVISA